MSLAVFGFFFAFIACKVYAEDVCSFTYMSACVRVYVCVCLCVSVNKCNVKINFWLRDMSELYGLTSFFERFVYLSCIPEFSRAKAIFSFSLLYHQLFFLSFFLFSTNPPTPTLQAYFFFFFGWGAGWSTTAFCFFLQKRHSAYLIFSFITINGEFVFHFFWIVLLSISSLEPQYEEDSESNDSYLFTRTEIRPTLFPMHLCSLAVYQWWKKNCIS